MKTSFSLALIINLVIVVFTVHPALSDGIYASKDLSQLTAEHIVVKLSEDQIPEVEQNRTLVFSEDQLAELKKCFIKFPLRIDVISSRWKDCVCGMGLYAVWCRKNEIAIPMLAIESFQSAYEKSEIPENPDQSDIEQDFAQNILIPLIFDSRGRIFCGGTEVSRSAIIDNMKILALFRPLFLPLSSVKVNIQLDPPPPISKIIDSEILRFFNLSSKLGKFLQIDVYPIGLNGDDFFISSE
ncbi:MAG: hypothetical protein CVV64_11480 [Candidatus Wallbacteria bacterium HGW-Wallbacteria-1]|jgi:hypothetical protein|uniref:Uncharacterized protein n=1 Tax=Candidatus Wallbacteria bacterium HGW-Wallbacteria-1 TaxID=2013854 RepID=A0A2N1PNM3_9BACT|nr:MAG: hypothetical protein CVV64_11480 [Candidatus Wallbacteria bacterium HGW-Wallbacteria-1]